MINYLRMRCCYCKSILIISVNLQQVELFKQQTLWTDVHCAMCISLKTSWSVYGSTPIGRTSPTSLTLYFIYYSLSRDCPSSILYDSLDHQRIKISHKFLNLRQIVIDIGPRQGITRKRKSERERERERERKR